MQWASQVITDALRKTVEAEIIDRRLILAGEFAAEVAHLTELKAQVEERLGMIKTVKDAEAVLAKAKADGEKLLAETQLALTETAAQTLRLQDAARAELAVAHAKVEAVSAKEAELARQISNVAAAKLVAAEMLRSAQDAARRNEADKAELDAHAAAVASASLELSAKAEALSSEKARFNAKLEALKAE